MITSPFPRAWYGASIAEFFQTQTDSVVGRLATNSDIAVAKDGTILCFFYGSGDAPGFAGQHLTLARFNLEWLTGGKDSLNDGKK